MSIPRDHHYLPRFYVKRWSVAGKVVRFVRPVPHLPIHSKIVGYASVGFEHDLYAYAEAESERDRQRLELDYFQRIDDRAAVALQKLDHGKRGTGEDRLSLCQFATSLMYRSPSRIAHLRDELAKRMGSERAFDANDPGMAELLRDQVNELLGDLISSPNVLRLIASMKIVRLDIGGKLELVTSDMPLLQSQGLARPDGFLLLPYGPKKAAIFVHDLKVASAFSSQKPDSLIRALNDAIVRQAQEIVVGAPSTNARFIENRLLRGQRVAGDGVYRWSVP